MMTPDNHWGGFFNKPYQYKIEQIEALSHDELLQLHQERTVHGMPFVYQLLDYLAGTQDDLLRLFKLLEVPEFNIYQITTDRGTILTHAFINATYHIRNGWAQKLLIFNQLLDHSDVNFIGAYDGQTMMHWVAKAGQFWHFNELAERGVPFDVKDLQGKTPYDLLAHRLRHDKDQELLVDFIALEIAHKGLRHTIKPRARVSL